MSFCQCWIPVVTSAAISVVTHALLLLVLYILLSRKIDQNSRGIRVKSSSGKHPRPEPSSEPNFEPNPEPSSEPSPAAALAPGGDKAQPPMAQHPAPAYAGSSDTSSDTSEDSVDSPSHPQGQSRVRFRRAQPRCD
ncbi:putative transcription factor SOX-14 [Malurus melanocephalus]|uniref:putative transcription factor SOX-14 n=1 Tax=Malurus melanocephalus TaxID=175006 RepID=UPI002547EE0E|nr:putative transcription factor SOX-14 [Malurus melanocephalus]